MSGVRQKHIIFFSVQWSVTFRCKIAGVQKLLQQISDWKLSSFRHACVPFSSRQNISKPAGIPWFPISFHALQASPSSYNYFVGSYNGSNIPFICHVLFVTRIPGSKNVPGWTKLQGRCYLTCNWALVCLEVYQSVERWTYADVRKDQQR